jgi:hypothetical protein
LKRRRKVKWVSFKNACGGCFGLVTKIEKLNSKG